MSYCRWSSDDFRCDLYIYESEDGFQIHVAGNRLKYDHDALPPAVSILDDLEAFTRRDRMLMDMLDECEQFPIRLPYAGEDFLCESADECADKVEELIAIGYIVPDGVVADLRSEVDE